MNVPRIKGSHNAMLSGMFAAEAVAEALAAGRAMTSRTNTMRLARLADRGGFARAQRQAAVVEIRHLAGIALGGLDMWSNTLGFSLFGTLKHGKPDYATLKPAAECTPIAYPKPDGTLTFDRLSSVFLSNTNHEEDQPPHLVVKDMALQKASEHDVYAGPRRAIARPGSTNGCEEGGRARSS